MANARVHVFIAGKVQRVGYRSWTMRKALQLGVTGWIRNLKDGRVEGVFEGENQSVRRLLELCWRGPAGCVVNDVETVFEQPKGEKGFRIIS